MHDLNAAETTNPAAPRSCEGPEVMQAFVARHRPFFILLGLLVAQLLLLSFQITRNHDVRLIKIWAVATFGPFERSLTGVTDATKRAWRSYRGLWRAQQQNQELNVELVAAHAQIQRLSQEAAETERLRTLLDLKSHVPFQTVAAEVIAATPGLSSNALLIDKGTDFGLTSDLAVITPSGVAGKIIAVFPHAAQVLLITDPSSGVGSVLERSRVQGVLKGASNNLCQLEYVMNEESVSPGEVVLTSGLDQVYPKGLPVGTVLKVGEGNIYKTIAVRPAAALDRLEIVLVVLKPSSTEQQATNLGH